jgi:hypothetical protein
MIRFQAMVLQATGFNWSDKIYGLFVDDFDSLIIIVSSLQVLTHDYVIGIKDIIPMYCFGINFKII